MLTELKKEGGKSFTYEQKNFQSRDQAKIKISLAQSKNSGQNFRNFVTAVIRQHHVVLRVVEIFWKGKI